MTMMKGERFAFDVVTGNSGNDLKIEEIDAVRPNCESRDSSRS